MDTNETKIEDEEGEVQKKKLLQEEQIAEFLVCNSETSLFDVDKVIKSQDDSCIEKVDDAYPLSSTLFPSIIKIHTTGSRAEKMWNSKSDTDIFYEIGPGLIYQKDQAVRDGGCFLLEEADHTGFYRIYDSKGGGYLYPKDLQMKLAPTFQYLENDEPSNDAKRRKTNHTAVKFDNRNLSWKRNDHVIGLKLEKWPDTIKDHLVTKYGLQVVKPILGKE